LLKEIGDVNKIRLEFAAGPEAELRELLANLALHAQVLSDLCGQDLTVTYETAAEKVRKRGLIPRLAYEEAPSLRVDIAETEAKPVLGVEKLLEQLRQEFWQPLRKEAIQLLKEVHPLIFSDPVVAQVVDRLVERNLEKELQERRGFIEEFASWPGPLDLEEIRREVGYVLRENVRYWVQHWAIEEIAQEIETKGKPESAGG